MSELIHQRQCDAEQAQGVSQRKKAAVLQDNRGGPAQAKVLPASDPNGLPHQLKVGIESLSGMTMDHVRVHYNSDQPAQLQAHAYAQGADIHLAPGQEKHLPHEAWHVVQQAQGRVGTTLQMKNGVHINDAQALETEADVMGAKASSFSSAAETAAQLRPSASASGSHQLVGQLRSAASENAPVRLLGRLEAESSNTMASRHVLQRLYAKEHKTDQKWMKLKRLDGVFVNGNAVYARGTARYVVVNKLDDSHAIVQLVSTNGMALDDFDSDDDSDFEGIESTSVTGLKKSDKKSHVANSATRHTTILNIPSLEQHADAIHQAAGGDSRLTIVTSQFLTSQNDYLRFAFANQSLMPPKAREHAQNLGYTVVRGTKTHGEGNLETYAAKHQHDLLFKGHGCDKPACAMCAQILKARDNAVSFGSQGETNKYSPTYYHEGMSNLTSPSMQATLGMIGSNYHPDGTKR